jgi:undecaprenyl-diphosphatase
MVREPALRPSAAFGLALAGLAAFTAVAVWVEAGDPSGFDYGVIESLQSLGGPTLDRVIATFTLLGNTVVVVVALVVVAGWALYERARAVAIAIAVVGVATETIYPIVKLAFHRFRPDAALAKVTIPETYSFPSGHAVVAMAVYGFLAVAIIRLRPRSRRPIAFAAPILVLAIGASRSYLGVHWPTDVLAGFALGSVILVAGVVVLDRIGARHLPP